MRGGGVSGGELALLLAGAGHEVNASNAISACVDCIASKADGDGTASDALVAARGVVGCPSVGGRSPSLIRC